MKRLSKQKYRIFGIVIGEEIISKMQFKKNKKLDFEFAAGDIGRLKIHVEKIVGKLGTIIVNVSSIERMSKVNDETKKPKHNNNTASQGNPVEA